MEAHDSAQGPTSIIPLGFTLGTLNKARNSHHARQSTLGTHHGKPDTLSLTTTTPSQPQHLLHLNLLPLPRRRLGVTGLA